MCCHLWWLWKLSFFKSVTTAKSPKHYDPNAMIFAPNLSQFGCWDVNNPRGWIMQMDMLCLAIKLVKNKSLSKKFYGDLSKTAFLRFCNNISKIILFKNVRDFRPLMITTVKRNIDHTLEKKLLLKYFFIANFKFTFAMEFCFQKFWQTFEKLKKLF